MAAGQHRAAQRAEWRKALAALARTQRQRRGKRPAPPVTGVRLPQPRKETP